MKLDRILELLFGIILLVTGVIILIYESFVLSAPLIFAGLFLLKNSIQNKNNFIITGFHGFLGGMAVSFSFMILSLILVYGTGGRLGSYLFLLSSLILLFLGVRWVFLSIKNYGGINKILSDYFYTAKKMLREKPVYWLSYAFIILVIIGAYASSREHAINNNINPNLLSIPTIIFWIFFFIVLDLSYTLYNYDKYSKKRNLKKQKRKK